MIIIMMIILIFLFINKNSSQAFQISEQEYVSFFAQVVYREISYDGEILPVPIAICSSINGKVPTYSLKYEKECVDEVKAYSAQLKGVLKDNQVKNILLNGYPNQTYQKLNAVNEEEAYIITQMAIFNIHYQYDFEKFKMKEDSKYPGLISKIKEFIQKIELLEQEEIIELTIDEKTSEWKAEGENWVSKEYKMMSNMQFEDYIVNIKSSTEVRVVNQNNQLQDKFFSNEEFKILIPKHQSSDFQISVEAEFLSYPVRFTQGQGNIWEEYILLGEMESIETHLIQSYEWNFNNEEESTEVTEDETTGPQDKEIVTEMKISTDEKLPQTGM